MATLAWVFVLFLAEATRMAVLPRTVPVFYFLLGTIVIAGSRFAAKFLLYASRPQGGSRDVVIYGAGESGRQLAAALAGQGGRQVAGFLDDDPNLQGRDVSGVRVYRAGPAAGPDRRFRRQGGDPLGADAREQAPPGDLYRAQRPSGHRADAPLAARDRLGKVPGQPAARDRYRRSARALLGARRSRTAAADGSGPRHSGVGRRRLDRLGTLPHHRAALAEKAGAARSQRIRAVPDRARAAEAGDLSGRSGSGLGRRRSTGAPRARRPSGRGRLPRRRPQARAAGRGQCARGRAQQCLRHAHPGARRVRGRGRQLRSDLDRQGGAADQRDGRDQALGRTDRPEFRRPRAGGGHRTEIRRRPLRQCARLQRLGRAAVPRADRRMAARSPSPTSA